MIEKVVINRKLLSHLISKFVEEKRSKFKSDAYTVGFLSIILESIFDELKEETKKAIIRALGGENEIS